MRRRRGGAQFTVVRAQKPPQVDRTTGFIESDNTVSKTREISSRFCVLSSLRFRLKNLKRKRKSSALDRSSRRRTTTAFFWFVSKDVECIAREVVPFISRFCASYFSFDWKTLTPIVARFRSRSHLLSLSLDACARRAWATSSPWNRNNSTPSRRRRINTPRLVSVGFLALF